MHYKLSKEVQEKRDRFIKLKCDFGKGGKQAEIAKKQLEDEFGIWIYSDIEIKQWEK
jgi:hypothetical protein